MSALLQLEKRIVEEVGKKIAALGAPEVVSDINDSAAATDTTFTWSAGTTTHDVAAAAVEAPAEVAPAEVQPVEVPVDPMAAAAAPAASPAFTVGGGV